MTLTHNPPRPHSDPKLVSSTPSASAPASVRISHVQLRDLIVCPTERGLLWYVGENCIVEQDMLPSTSHQRVLAMLKFTPVTLSTLRLGSSDPDGKDVILLAAGGQDAELFLALYTYTPRRHRRGKSLPNPRVFASTTSGSADISIDIEERGSREDIKEEEEKEAGGYSTASWHHTSSLIGSINNNVLLYMPPPPADNGFDDDERQARAVSPRLVVSNNDCTVKFFDVSLARKGLRRSTLQRPPDRVADARYWRQDPGLRGTCEGEGFGEKELERIVRYERVGCLRLPVPVNHTSISPDGSTVLSCGDASTVYLHRILPVRDGTSLLFEPLATYTIPPPSPLPSLPSFLSSSNPQTRPLLSRYAGHYDPGGAYLPFAFVNGSWVLAGPHPYLNDSSSVEIPPACFTTAWSSDGMRFAVASQEGMVRVWDVRSKEPLACAGWETGPGGAAATSGDGEDANTSGIASGSGISSMDAQRALYEFTGGAPPWGIRSLKFAKNASGRELLVFTEHVSRVHVIDADTFSRHDVLRVPHVQPGPSVLQSRDDARLTPFPPNLPTTQYYSLTDVPRWANDTDPVIPDRLSRFVVDTSWGGPEDNDAGTATEERSGARSRETRVRDEIMGNVILRAREEGRLEGRLAGRLEMRARARRLGLVPAPLVSESNIGTGRVLTPNVPLSRSPVPMSLSPQPMAFRTLPGVALDEEALNNSRDYALDSRRRNPPIGAAAVRHILRSRARERERRELDEERGELRRRSPVSRLRDDAQMEEDIAFHAERERLRILRDMHGRGRIHTSGRSSAVSERRVQTDRERQDLDLLNVPYRGTSPSVDAGPELEDDDVEGRGPVVIPSLSSARSEEDVRTVLAAHGIPSVRSRAEMLLDRVPDEQLLSARNVQDAEDGRPGSSSASTVSSTSVSGAASTRAQAGSLIGERHSSSARARVNSLMTPSMRNMRATQAALRAIDEYRMEVDGEDGEDGDDSEATELDCAEPIAGTQLDDFVSDTPAGEMPVSAGESSIITVSETASPTLSPTSDASGSSSNSSMSSSSSSVANISPSDRPSSAPIISQSSSQSHSLPPCRDLIESTDRLDVAGVAFDPSGAHMYVATVDGITEWTVQGVQQRWWHAGGCV